LKFLAKLEATRSNVRSRGNVWRRSFASFQVNAK
jgi:hypothetical protein